jgi:hypothetical protein
MPSQIDQSSQRFNSLIGESGRHGWKKDVAKCAWVIWSPMILQTRPSMLLVNSKMVIIKVIEIEMWRG